MRDADIRYGLRRHLESTFAYDSSTIILEELGICQGIARVDVAVINGDLKGFEIKSNKDTLNRLPLQCSAYSKVFDTLTIVVEVRHLRHVEAIVPKWWGVMLAQDRDGHSSLDLVRHEQSNPNLDPLSLVQLLWRNEALSILSKKRLARGLGSKPRRYLG